MKYRCHASQCVVPIWHWTVYFDECAQQCLGTGGFLIWMSERDLVVVQVLYYGGEYPTNNVVEVILEHAVHRLFDLGW